MFGFLSWEETRALRYQSFHSHPEARPNRPNQQSYLEPQKLRNIVKTIESQADPRIIPMIRGYFKDIYLSLLEIHRVCSNGARVALVVGNSQYYGQPIPVDELAAQIGEQVGFQVESLLAVRYRGNSAQQMGKYGRRPSRESIVIFAR